MIEANALAEIDYTGATMLADLVGRLRERGVDVAVARLESVRAQQSFARLGLFALIGRDHVFRSVQEAIDALAPARGLMLSRERDFAADRMALCWRRSRIGVAPARRQRGLRI